MENEIITENNNENNAVTLDREFGQKEKKYYLTKIKSIAKLNSIFKLMVYLPRVLLILLFFVPFVHLNSDLGSADVSIIDMFVARFPNNESFESTLVDLLVEDFRSKYGYNIIAQLTTFSAVSLIPLTIKALFCIIPELNKGNVEKALRYRFDNYKHKNDLFILDVYDSERKTSFFGKKLKEGIFAKLIDIFIFLSIILICLVCIFIPLVFPCVSISFLSNTTFATVSPLFTILVFLSVLSMAIGGIIGGIYYEGKYHSTLQLCQSIKYDYSDRKHK